MFPFWPKEYHFYRNKYVLLNSKTRRQVYYNTIFTNVKSIIPIHIIFQLQIKTQYCKMKKN